MNADDTARLSSTPPLRSPIVQALQLSRREVIMSMSASGFLPELSRPSVHSDPRVTITIDETPQRIVTDAGAGGYQAFPDVCRLKSGDLYCVFYAGYGHVSHPNTILPKGGRVCGIQSRDEGKSWSAPTTVIDTMDDDRDPSVCCLPDGNLIVNFFRYGLNGECDTCIATSHDAGRSWSEPQIVAPGFATSSPVRRLRSGRLLLPVYTVDGNGKRFYPGISISNDRGHSWSSVHPIGQRAGKVLDETDLFERADGTVLAVMRQVMCGSESTDGGQTWGPVFDLGFPGHCPYLLQTKSGVLLMAHRLPGTSLHYSLDEGRSWHGSIQIDTCIGAYPSMVELRDRTVLCVYYEEGANSAIRSKRIRITLG